MAFQFLSKRRLISSFGTFHFSTLLRDYQLLKCCVISGDLINVCICACSFCLELRRHLNSSVKKMPNYHKTYE